MCMSAMGRCFPGLWAGLGYAVGMYGLGRGIAYGLENFGRGSMRYWRLDEIDEEAEELAHRKRFKKYIRDFYKAEEEKTR